MVLDIATDSDKDYRRDPQPITLIGHSMGGDSVVAFAKYLDAMNIPVSLVVTYDPSRFVDKLPPNIERYINLYQSSNFAGRKVPRPTPVYPAALPPVPRVRIEQSRS